MAEIIKPLNAQQQKQATLKPQAQIQAEQSATQKKSETKQRMGAIKYGAIALAVPTSIYLLSKHVAHQSTGRSAAYAAGGTVLFVIGFYAYALNGAWG